MHGIENLALLSTENNSSLSNGLFIEKRAKIIEMDKNGEFIPICTKNVFLKYYSDDPSNIYFWSKQDQGDYKNSIINTLKEFLGEKKWKIVPDLKISLLKKFQEFTYRLHGG